MNGISKETFLSVKGDERDAILYDLLAAIYTRSEDGCQKQKDICEAQTKTCDKRFEKIDRSNKSDKWMDRGFIIILTGVFAWIASWFK